MNEERLNEIVSKDGETVFVIKNLMVFWMCSLLGFAYNQFIEPYAVMWGFREPYSPFSFVLGAFGFGVLGVFMYLVYLGVITDKATEFLSKKQKLKQLLLGVLTAFFVLGLTLVIKLLS